MRTRVSSIALVGLLIALAVPSASAQSFWDWDVYNDYCTLLELALYGDPTQDDDTAWNVSVRDVATGQTAGLIERTHGDFTTNFAVTVSGGATYDVSVDYLPDDEVPALATQITMPSGCPEWSPEAAVGLRWASRTEAAFTWPAPAGPIDDYEIVWFPTAMNFYADGDEPDLEEFLQVIYSDSLGGGMTVEPSADGTGEVTVEGLPAVGSGWDIGVAARYGDHYSLPLWAEFPRPDVVLPERIRSVRLAGASRTETAIELSDAIAAHKTLIWGTHDAIVVASAANYPDALSAAQLGWPVLLTDPDALSADTEASIKGWMQAGELDTVYVVGGTAAVSTSVVDRLCVIGVPSVTRLAGTDRFETATAVATAPDAASGPAINPLTERLTMIVVPAGSFEEALVAGPLVSATHMTMLLTERDTLTPSTRSAMVTLRQQYGEMDVVVVGDADAVGPAVFDEIRATGNTPLRLSGSDAWHLSVRMADYAKDAWGLPPQRFLLANGERFPDALAASRYGGRFNAPVLLTPADGLPSRVSDHLVASGCQVEVLAVAGGTAAVSAATETSALSALRKSCANATPAGSASAPPVEASSLHSHMMRMFSGRRVDLGLPLSPPLGFELPEWGDRRLRIQ